MIESERNLPSGLRTDLGARRLVRPQGPCYYIAEDNPVAAQRFVRSVFQLLERLPRFPESGRIVSEFNDAQIREVLRKPCRIVYRIKPEEQIIEITRVWHAARGILEL